MSYQKETNGTLKILEENNYYPFGLKHSAYNNTNLANANYKYKYNGKELQEEFNINLYDYGARNYDPAIGRWFNVDPMAPKYFSHSPYTYTLNNPVYFIDPDGMQISVGEQEDPPVINGGELPEVTVTVSKSKRTEYYGISINIPTPDLTSAFFGNHVDGAYKRILSTEEGREKYGIMQKAKRDGEKGLIIGSAVMLSPIAIGIVLESGTLALLPKIEVIQSALASTEGQILSKTAIDMTVQFVSTGDVNGVSALVGALIPGSSLKSIFTSSAMSEAVDLTMKELSEPNSINVNSIFTSGVKTALAPIGATSGDLIKGLTNSGTVGDIGGSIISSQINQKIDNEKK